MKKRVILSISTLMFVVLFGLPSESYGLEEEHCETSTVVLTNTIYNNSLNVTDVGLVFFTNEVCDATAYTWSVDGFTIATTRSPNLSIDAIDFTRIIPAGSCDEYNARIIDKVYSSNLTVQANAGAQNRYTIPVYIKGVEKCKIASVKSLKFPKETKYTYTIVYTPFFGYPSGTPAGVGN